jgi:hypothetical protein
MIVIIIDEIDRVEKKELVKIWKILNIIKRMITISWKDWNILCFYSADSRHLNWFYFSDSDVNEPLNFFQYFKKFSESRYDIHELSKKDLWDYIYRNYLVIQKILFWIDKIVLDRINFDIRIWMIFKELENLWIPITIRNVDDTMTEIENLSLLLNERANKDSLWASWGSVKKYIWKKMSSSLIFHLIYFTNIDEKVTELWDEFESADKLVVVLITCSISDRFQLLSSFNKYDTHEIIVL